jgi:DDE superfamily endonuclease
VAKGGLHAALSAVGLGRGVAPGHLDEMRLGLVGTTRRRWGIRGVKIVQPLQRRYEWSYLVLLVDGERGRLWWIWQPTMKSDHLLASLDQLWQASAIPALVWDGAPAHRERRVRALGLPLVELPPYSPELNPPERIFEEVRRHVEGEVYATLADKQAAVEAYLQELAADPDRVRSLAGWDWIHDAIEQLTA